MPSSLALSSVILVVGLVAGIGAGVVVWQGTRNVNEATPLPTPSVANIQSSPTVLISTETPAITSSPTWFPIQSATPSIRGLISSPTPKASVIVSPRPTADTVSPGITWIDLPESVRSGEKFTLRWRINGPAGAHGEKTTLQVAYDASQQTGNSSSSASSTSSNSFGPYTVPATFDSQFSFGTAPATIRVVVTADVGGKQYQTEAAIPLR